MGRGDTGPSLTDGFESQADLDDAPEHEDQVADEPPARGDHRLAELRRRIEERHEYRRMRQHIDYFVLDLDSR